MPKFHYMTHSAHDQSKVTNPRWVHVYADEDMVGKVKKIVVACHAKTASTRVLERYNILFGARWLRALMAARGSRRWVNDCCAGAPGSGASLCEGETA